MHAPLSSSLLGSSPLLLLLLLFPARVCVCVSYARRALTHRSASPSLPLSRAVPIAIAQLPEHIERAFISTAARVEAVKQRKEQLEAFKGGGGLFAATLTNLAAALASPLRLSVSPAGNGSAASAATPAPASVAEALDPRDPQHAELISWLRPAGDAIMALISPHLLGKSVEEWNCLVDFLCRPAALDVFFGREELAAERELLLMRMEEDMMGY